MFGERKQAGAVPHGMGGVRGARLAIASLFISGALVSGCTVVEGNTSSLDNMKSAAAQAAPSQAPAPATTTADAASASVSDTSFASAGIPIPLISPRHANAAPVQVASVDPRAGLSALGGSGGTPVRQLAGVYLKYGSALALAEKSKLGTPTEVRRVLKEMRYSQPEVMAQGWYAVQAMTAAQTNAFAQGVRDEVRRIGQDRVLAALNDPDYVLRLPGADAATTAIMASVTAENERMLSLRKRFLDTAQQFMRQKWGMSEPMQPVRQADAREPGQSFRALIANLSPISEAHAYSRPALTKILALGARQVMAVPMAAAERDETSACLNWARLNLNQCIAAAHFPSEEAWCAGTHGVEEVRACWASVLPASATMTPAAH